MAIPESGNYEVSSAGQVRRASYRRADGSLAGARLLSQRIDKKGYYIVTLPYRGCRRPVLVHRLVALAFVERPDGAEFVLHLDGDRLNNSADNLCWSTLDRVKFNARNGNKTRESIGKPVRQYTVDGKFIAEYPSASIAAIAVGVVLCGDISRVCRRLDNRVTSAGFIWRYADDDEIYKE